MFCSDIEFESCQDYNKELGGDAVQKAWEASGKASQPEDILLHLYSTILADNQVCVLVSLRYGSIRPSTSFGPPSLFPALLLQAGIVYMQLQNAATQMYKLR